MALGNIQAMTTPDETRQAISLRIKWTREAMGLNQASFARLVGLSPQGLNNYENYAQRPEIDQALQICRATGVTLDWIYRGDRSGLPQRISEKLAEFEAEARRA